MKSYLLILLFFPFAALSQSPGGVATTNLKLWNKANAGVTTSGSNVTAWTDQTGINSFSITGTPVLQPATLNYNPTVSFNGSSRFTGNTAINNITQAFTIGKITNNAGTNSGALMGTTTTSSYEYFFHTEGNTLYCGGAIISVYTGFANGSNNIDYSLLSEDLSKTPAASDQIRLNGFATTNSAGGDPTVITSAIPTIGSRGTENIANGSGIGEAILFDASLPAADVSKIESYLALKYGITLNNSGGGTTGDYTSSGDIIIWDADNAGSYHNNIIGIGRDDNSGLTQKQSQQPDDNTRIYTGTLAASNAANAGTFSSDGQFVMMGNNNLALNSNGSTEYPSAMGIYSRIDREWKITNTNFDGTFSLDIKLNTTPVNPSDLRILVDDDGDFSNGNTTIYNPTISYSANVVTVSGISVSMIPANSTKYLTIVSLSSSTTLPVRLIDFTAAVDNKQVQLIWQTGSENNNAFFMVERSVNAIQWQDIGKVNGTGHSDQLSYYSYRDENPVRGLSYYRLRQTDFDGNYSLSPVRPVTFIPLKENKLTIYPNPATDYIIIEGSEEPKPRVFVFDAMGRDVSASVKTLQGNLPGKMMIGVSKLSPGIYTIKVGLASTKLNKQ